MVHLGDSITLPCGVKVKNRFLKSAMSESLATVDHAPTEELCRLYGVWALGGSGLVVTGNVMIDSKALGEPRNVVIENERHFAELQRLAREGTQDNTHLWVQLNHPGKQSLKLFEIR